MLVLDRSLQRKNAEGAEGNSSLERIRYKMQGLLKKTNGDLTLFPARKDIEIEFVTA